MIVGTVGAGKSSLLAALLGELLLTKVMRASSVEPGTQGALCHTRRYAIICLKPQVLQNHSVAQQTVCRCDCEQMGALS